MLRVAKLARDGRVHLFLYSEIDLEILNGTPFPSKRTADCLDGATIDHVPAAIERSKFQQMSIEEFCKKDTRVRFFRWLLSLDDMAPSKRPGFMAMLSDFERRNFESLNRFREICKDIAPTHYPDAFHLWTAEVNGLDYFLTADKKFINAVTKGSRIALVTRPICPADFVEELIRSASP